MKKYIGTKQIEAEPMTRGDAWGKHLLREKPSTENFDDEGYHVRYEDGYESWSLVKPFEEAYKCADSFLDRLVIEQKDLAAKLEKLCLFVESPKFEESVKDENQRRLLLAQREYMGEYLNIINQRVKLLKE